MQTSDPGEAPCGRRNLNLNLSRELEILQSMRLWPRGRLGRDTVGFCCPLESEMREYMRQCQAQAHSHCKGEPLVSRL